MNRALTWLRSVGLEPEKERILVAVSGGRDSMALAHLLVHARFRIALAHVNYHLRGQDSDDDEAMVRQWASENEVEIHVLDHPIHVGNVQSLAREVRYSFFDRLAEAHQYTHIATGHHLGDSLETSFINLIRGTGTYGVAGISAMRGKLIRPLHVVDRSAIDQYIEEHQIPFRDDVSNESERYLRNRVRHQLLPVLHALETNASDRIQRSFNQLADDGGAMKDMAAMARSKVLLGILIELDHFPESSMATWLYHALHPWGFTREAAAQLASTRENGKRVIHGQYEAVKWDNCILVGEGEGVGQGVGVGEGLGEGLGEGISKGQANQISVHGPGHHVLGNLRIAVTSEMPAEPTRPATIGVPITAAFPLCIRGWRQDDTFQPQGCAYRVRVGHFLRDRKLKPRERFNTAVMCDAQGEILWIAGVAVSEPWCVQSSKRKDSPKLWVQVLNDEI